MLEAFFYFQMNLAIVLGLFVPTKTHVKILLDEQGGLMGALWVTGT